MITFIIGNGFDLNLGMKTRYTDVYDTYIATDSENDILKEFKKDLLNNYDNWSDFEMGMAQYTSNFANENDFVMCVRDFKKHLVSHLSSEQDMILRKFSSSATLNEAVIETMNSVKSFYGGLSQNIVREIKAMLFQGCRVNFITFNYTSILDFLIDNTNNYFQKAQTPYILLNPIHIHGSLDYDVVLGADNINQISAKYKVTKMLQRAFIKPYFNFVFDKQRVHDAIEAINRSNIICTFGWSWGESDGMWISLVKKWLLDDDSNHLINYQFDETYYPTYNFDEKLDREDELRDKLIERLGFNREESEKVYERIHLPISYKIFDYTSAFEKHTETTRQSKIS